MQPQQYCLRWKYHHSNLQTMFSQLLDRGCFCDVTLACEGQIIRAHRVVLCACSTFFDNVLTNYPTEKDPIVIMKDAKFADVKCLIEFMYKGEINVEHSKLTSLLKTAEELKIKGLAEVSFQDDDSEPIMEPEMSLQCPRDDSPADRNSPADVESNTVPKLPLLMQIPGPIKRESFAHKRKRGRPPLDDYDVFGQVPKISHVEGSHSSHSHHSSQPQHSSQSPHPTQSSYPTYNPHPNHSTQPIQPMNPYSQDPEQQSTVEENTLGSGEPDEPKSTQRSSWHEPNAEPHGEMEEEKEEKPNIEKLSPLDNDNYYDHMDPDRSLNNEINDHESYGEAPYDLTGTEHDMDEIDLSEYHLSQEDVEKFKDVVKMDTYLSKGRRPQFWEEPFTRNILDLIKHKKLEMKKAAQLLGVSYGTLYGRYREVYGCLKHPYRGQPLVSRYDTWKNKQTLAAGSVSSDNMTVRIDHPQQHPQHHSHPPPNVWLQ